MPASKKSTRKSSQHIPRAVLSKAYEGEISYETQVIITVILLLFVYPIGIIFMWWWMKNWPLWLKLLLTLPFLLGIFAILGAFVFLVSIIGRVRINERLQERHFRYMYPTPVVSISPTTSSPTY